jgi:hypothetical protein
MISLSLQILHRRQKIAGAAREERECRFRLTLSEMKQCRVCRSACRGRGLLVRDIHPLTVVVMISSRLSARQDQLPFSAASRRAQRWCRPPNVRNRNHGCGSGRLCLDWPLLRRILLQGIVNAVLMVVANILSDKSAQLLHVQCDDMRLSIGNANASRDESRRGASR